MSRALAVPPDSVSELPPVPEEQLFNQNDPIKTTIIGGHDHLFFIFDP
jgi:hypothetical protein